MTRVSGDGLDAAISEILEDHALPEGYSIKKDTMTKNLMVTGPTLGFLITSVAIADGLHVTCFGRALRALIKAEQSAELEGLTFRNFPKPSDISI